MNKILIHSLSFYPDGVSTAYIYNDIALKFKERGYEVVVLTSTPHNNVVENELKIHPFKRKLCGLYFVSDYNGIKIIHVPQKKFKSTDLRLLGFVYWHIVSFFLGIFEKKIDIILSPSPPLTIGIVNIILGKLKGSKVIYNVQEVYPDLLIEGKGLKSKGVISILQWLEKFVYNHSDSVTTIDKVLYDTIINRFKDKSKLHIIPNFVDTSIFKPISIDKITVDSNYFPVTDSLKLMYAGNIGYAQDWKLLIEVASQIINENIEFFVIGDGTMKDYLEDEIKIRNLRHVHLVPYQQRESMPSLMAYSDLQFIFMSPETDGHGFPSKVYTIMACAKPMLVCSGANTPIVNFLKDKNCSFLIDESDFSKKTDQLVKVLMSIDRVELMGMGARGFNNINLSYSKEIVTDKYIGLAESLLE
ncbi:MAG: glycosyltransferase family 4 protein [Bacteroidales bacterium]|nr:glycosyltransferase family 4 protein [Bacteroidales bacterium]MCK9312398.1 glycosyltransferase family 4 protein [Bacteroidales bacterium]MDD2612923.1 glycosyltransferase family 4 protein [Bacteroidales bacterium]MDD4713038.1 glycosyltransferase family 4 protein [Bacteroidales bacterium]